MRVAAALACATLVVALLLAAAYAPRFVGREPYGPPPGARRALSLAELGDRGWTSAPLEYVAPSASAASHMIMHG